MDLLLGTDGDLVFDNEAVTVTTSKTEAIAQKLSIKLRTFLGEWFLNTSLGVPYFQEVFGKTKSKAAIDIIFRKQISEDEDVVAITEFSSTLESDRSYSLSFRVRTISGETTDTINVEIGA